MHTSTATVLVMPEMEEVDVQINKSDLRIDTYRASGAGGQSGGAGCFIYLGGTA